MSIVLKGIDLPTDRKPYAIEVTYRFEGADGLFSEEIFLSPNQAIQIPKGHGRLIDGDELISNLRIYESKYCGEQGYITQDDIIDAPTILEAE